MKALAAYDNKIPFYVALPSSTIDLKLNSGVGKIPIEERDPKELSHMYSFSNNKLTDNLIYFKNANIFNPAFDVTPAKYITKLITQHGICNASKKEILKNIKSK